MKHSYGIFPTYQTPNTLQATPNDRANWAATLPVRGFAGTTWLDGALATRTRIISGIQTAVSQVQSDDAFALVYCGHGSISGANQCIVGADLQPVWDYEIAAMLSLLPATAKKDIILDCCYSGTGSYAESLQDKKNAPVIDQNIVPHVFTGKLKIPRKAAYPQMNRSAIVPTWREWAAGGPNQITYGVLINQKMNSLFTAYLAWALRNYPTKTASELMAIVRPYVMAAKPAQVPQLTGPNQAVVPL
jgi:hypothetical protein